MWRDKAKWWFATGEMIGGAATGLIAVALGSLLRPFIPAPGRWAAVFALLVLVAGHEFGLYRLPLPQNRRQVPQTVIFAGGRVGALQFGFEMGTGLRTFMTSGLPHVAVLAAALVAPWWAAILIGAGFGIGRAVMPMLRMAWRPPSGWDDRFLDRRQWISVALLTTALLALVGAATRSLG